MIKLLTDWKLLIATNVYAILIKLIVKRRERERESEMKKNTLPTVWQKIMAYLSMKKWKSISVSIDFGLRKLSENPPNGLCSAGNYERWNYFSISAGEIWYIARARALTLATHTCRSGNATLVIFHLERKHLPLHSTYRGSPYGAGNSNSALYIGLTRYQAGWQTGVASGYTSDKWWIGNKWGILTGNIRDIKKEPRTPRRISHIERLKSDTPVLSESNKGHVRRDMEYLRDASARLRL